MLSSKSDIISIKPPHPPSQALGYRDLDLHILTLSYPWLGLPVELLRRQRKPAAGLLAAHGLRVVVLYSMYEACQVAWSLWIYDKPIPDGMQVRGAQCACVVCVSVCYALCVRWDFGGKGFQWALARTLARATLILLRRWDGGFKFLVSFHHMIRILIQLPIIANSASLTVLLVGCVISKNRPSMCRLNGKFV